MNDWGLRRVTGAADLDMIALINVAAVIYPALSAICALRVAEMTSRLVGRFPTCRVQ